MIEYKVKVYDNGDRYWRNQDGQLHREDGPACEYANGSKVWYRNGQCHREDGPAVEYADGSKEWWLNGQYHREDGPACEYANGSKVWYRNGQLHREDGPAIEYVNGTKEWWRDGQRMTEETFNRRMGNIIEITRDHAESILEALEWAKSMIKMDGGDAHECLDDDIRKFKEATGL